MDMGLTGKRALVLASSRGLGLGIAEALAAEGCEVLMCGRSTQRLAELAETITARGAGRAQGITVDLSDPASVDTLVAESERCLGGVDILVNNTGGPPPGRMVDADMAVLAAQFDTMALRLMTLTQRLLPGMRERGWGRVLTVASSGVIQPIPTLGLSNAIRSTLVGWSKSLANDVAADGVTVNMLLPGRIHTERIDELDAAASKRTGQDIEAVRTAARATIPVGRYGTAEEFGAVACMLLSAPASYVTGSVVRCDGGAIASV